MIGQNTAIAVHPCIDSLIFIFDNFFHAIIGVIALAAISDVVPCFSGENIIAAVSSQDVILRVTRSVNIQKPCQRQVFDIVGQNVGSGSQDRIGSCICRFDNRVLFMIDYKIIVCGCARHIVRRSYLNPRIDLIFTPDRSRTIIKFNTLD